MTRYQYTRKQYLNKRHSQSRLSPNNVFSQIKKKTQAPARQDFNTFKVRYHVKSSKSDVTEILPKINCYTVSKHKIKQNKTKATRVKQPGAQQTPHHCEQIYACTNDEEQRRKKNLQYEEKRHEEKGELGEKRGMRCKERVKTFKVFKEKSISKFLSKLPQAKLTFSQEHFTDGAIGRKMILIKNKRLCNIYV